MKVPRHVPWSRRRHLLFSQRKRGEALFLPGGKRGEAVVFSGEKKGEHYPVETGANTKSFRQLGLGLMVFGL